MRKTVLVAVAALILTGCNGEPDTFADDKSAAAPAFANDMILNSGGTGDFLNNASTPGQVAQREQHAVLGTVDGFEDGRIESFTYSDGMTEKDRYVVIRVKVDETLKGAADASGYAYVTLRRGVQTYDKAGQMVDGGDAATPVDEFEKAIPIGSPILVMASPMQARSPEPKVVVENARAGVKSDAATILDGRNPQTILLDGGPESTLRGWQGDPDLTYGKAVAQVRAVLNGKG